MFRQRSRTASGSGPTPSPQVAAAASDKSATKDGVSSASTSDHPPTARRTRFGFSEIANLFIRLRRHQTKVAQAKEQSASDEPSNPTSSLEVPQQLAFPSAIVTSVSDTTHTSTAIGEAPAARVVLTPPTSPTRDRVRRLTGTPYARTRSTSGSNKAKAHHLVSSSGATPITHPGVRDNELQDAHSIPIEYNDRFEVVGGVNTATLLRATRRAILEIVASTAATSWANALSDEKWECTICGPKNGHYKVQIVYSATATQCSRPDVFRPVALDRAKGIPGLMTITKRNDD